MNIRHRNFVIAVVILVGGFFAGNGRIFGTAGPVTDDQAAKYAGRRTLVHGVVDEVREVGGTTYVNFGGKYPFQTFAAVISSKDYPKVFRSIPTPDEKEDGGFGEYWVTGRVELVNGRALIRVTELDQIVSDYQMQMSNEE
jgi:hypothetical protein